MEKLTADLLPALLAVTLVRKVMLMGQNIFILLVRAVGGLLLLLLLNRAAGFTGMLLPINPITVLAAGLLGFPGILCIALLEFFG